MRSKTGKDSFICPYCGGVILDDDQKYCDWCGSDLREKKTAKSDSGSSSSSSGSCLGSIGMIIFILLVLIVLIAKK